MVICILGELKTEAFILNDYDYNKQHRGAGSVVDGTGRIVHYPVALWKGLDDD